MWFFLFFRGWAPFTPLIDDPAGTACHCLGGKVGRRNGKERGRPVAERILEEEAGRKSGTVSLANCSAE